MQAGAAGETSPAKNFSHCIEDTIDKRGRIITAKAFGYLDGLVDSHFIRHIFDIEHFADRQPEDVPVGRGDPRQSPVDRGLPDQVIDPAAIGESGPQQVQCVGTSFFADMEKSAEECEPIGQVFGIQFRRLGKILLKEELESGLT